ncbi:MAG: type IV pilus secretin PilQ family protein [Pseudomonadales bacterium]|nr:type IV pilus secretin PilQ family protein [Pseudomonadales bacterium]
MRGWCAGITMLLCSLVAAASQPVLLQKVDVTTLPGDETQLLLTFDGTPPEPQTYDIEKPARISVDLGGVRSGLSSKYLSLGTGNAQSMTVLDTPRRTRLIIKLAAMTGHVEQVQGHQLILRIGAAEQTASAGHGRTNRLTAHPVNMAVENIDFHRGLEGDGQIQLDLSDASMSVDVKQEGNRIIARLPGASLPDRLKHKLDVTDFATPVSYINVASDKTGTVITVQPHGEYEYLAFQADKHFTISVKPMTAEEKQKKSQFAYTGQKLSLNFQDIDVRSVLQLIADFTSLNLVASDTVTGKITLRLQNVPWDQALDLILKTKGLAKRTVGNVMLVAPADEIARREKEELESNKQVDALAPLHTEFLQVSYAKASDIATLAQKIISPRGSLSTDSRTNTLIINETAKTIDDIRDLVRRLDVPVRQVMIEARVVLANTSTDKEMGVSWGIDGSQIGSNSAILYGGSNQTMLDSQTWYSNAMANPGIPQIRTITYPQNLAVDMSARQTGGSSFALGFVNSRGDLLNLELSAFQSEGHGEVVASPRVMTADKATARIASGQQIPYQQATSSGATSTSFVNAVLALEVTPSITPDGRIQMSLTVNKDSPSTSVSNNQLLIDTNSIKTSVLVNDGETVVLGGIYQTSVTTGVLKVPLLGDIPYLGALFRKDTTVTSKQELLIFITPTIYNDVVAQR